MSSRPRPKHTGEASSAQAVTAVHLDPNNEPVKLIDYVSFHPGDVLGVNLTLCTIVPTAMSDGTTSYPPMVAARLRLSPEMAKMLAQGLTKQLAMLERSGRPSN